MAPSLTPDDRVKVVRYLLLGQNPTTIASSIPCHLSTVYRVKTHLLLYGQPTRPSTVKTGRKKKITAVAGDALIDFLNERPDIPQSQILSWMRAEHGIETSTQAVRRELDGRKWTKDKALRALRLREKTVQKTDSSIEAHSIVERPDDSMIAPELRDQHLQHILTHQPPQPTNPSVSHSPHAPTSY